MKLTWDSPLSTIGGKKASEVVKETGFETIGDLLGHYPRSYVEKGRLSDLGQLQEGDLLSLVGEIVSSEAKTYQDRRTKRTAYRQEVLVKAEDGNLRMTFFDRAQHTAQWRSKQLAVGRIGMFSGKLKWFNGRWELNNPNSRMYGADDADDAVDAFAKMPELIPIYPVIGKVDSWQLEELIGLALDLVDDVPDPLPDAVRDGRELLTADQAYRWIHRPDDHRQLGAARKRLKYDEAFVTQAVLARRRAEHRAEPATPRPRIVGGLADRFDERLPFELTAGQDRIGDELADELAASHPMHRLLQGEVGSGKTLVALRAMLQVVDAGGQAALLAPTEVLAQQHLRSIRAMLGDLGEGGLLGAAEVSTGVTLLTGSMGTAARRQAMLDAASGEAGIVIGTHALLEEKVQFYDLGLVVVDEQHRFGVEQRAALTSKSGTPPHVLVMTATPIPRTVAMTVFGDLDTSTLSELPAGRGEVQTSVVPVRQQPAWLDRAWSRIREEVAAGRQAYVVCARIGDEPAPEEGPELHAVEDLAPELAAGPLAGLRIEKLHGRMTPDDKDRVMQAFAAGEVDVLVSTTVIEVGVDVPNSTVMVILDAERFGVSQLHQLRGRIGRGGHSGLCLLVTTAAPDSPSLERLTAVASTRDGFELSRIDLEQRREGDVLGVQQSGRRSSLKLLSVLTDEDVIVSARDAATGYLAQDPDLAGAPGLRAAVQAIEDSERADFLDKG
ncbi:ATP-dependent DNA helicase RecG [Nocardioides marmoriginsengisoli]|uniref:ATP-dependent DNA helicase RecG n=1 Tax=Nocardioides marmoriginsengisoli TaxID=661483 RepID=A0A3N0CQ58_9ACTN|nr:ATP-dependent DNA helicase RecG [Nocardioides marmoriginsengisoli]RNL65156.1 ATP-dependent DNA helicase RecG [Nocardioides marmoriginsengisoli]